MTMMHYTARVRADGLLELPDEARQLVAPGQEIDIQLESDPDARTAPRPNEKMLAMLRQAEEIKKTMAESDPSDTDRLIREGRVGAMYGYPPTE